MAEPFRGGDDIAFDMVYDAFGHRREPMNKDTGEIIDYGKASVIDREGNEVGGEVPAQSDPKLVPIPEAAVSALQKMPYGARMAWWRRNRPTLEQLAAQPAGLSAAQGDALRKADRKRAARLARKVKQA